MEYSNNRVGNVRQVYLNLKFIWGDRETSRRGRKRPSIARRNQIDFQNNSASLNFGESEV